MTEHVQLEIITACTLIAGQALTIWRAEMAAKRAQIAAVSAGNANANAAAANVAAVKVGEIAVNARIEQAHAIEQVHEAVRTVQKQTNGITEALVKAEGEKEYKAGTADEKSRVAAQSPEQRIEEIRGQQ